MKRSGSIFPDRIDSFSQLPLLQENSINSVAHNLLRSAVLKIEETIGSAILDSKVYGKFSSIKNRFEKIEETSNRVCLSNTYEYKDLTVLHLDEFCGWKERDCLTIYHNIGIVVDKSIVINGIIWVENKNSIPIGKKINIKNREIFESNDPYFIGTIVSEKEGFSQVLLRNKWID